MSVKELDLEGAEGEDGIEGTEIKETDIKDVTSDGRETWTNEKRNPIKIPIVCRVPQRIVIVMRSIERIMLNSNGSALEFGIFISGKFSEDGILIIGEEFYLPSQKVSGASIDFNDEPPDPKYNGVIHRHPSGCTSFSGTDSHYINSNFEFSLLYVNNDLTMGIFNLEHNGVRIQLPLSIEISYPIFNMDENEINNKIQRKELPSSTTGLLPGFSDNNIMGMLRDPNINNDSDDEEDDDDEDEKMYICKRCGNELFIMSFPEECDDCGMMLEEKDVTVVNDLSEVIPDDIIRPSLSDEDEGIWRPGQG